LPETRWYRFALNSTLPLTDGIDAYAFGTYADGYGVNDFNWRNPDTTGSSFNPSSVFPGFNLRSIYPTGYTPRFGQDSKDHQATVGARGPINDSLRWDFSVSSGNNRIEYFLDDSINASLGPNSPTSFKPGTLTQKEFNLNADFVYEWKDVNVAFGAERREEKYGMQAGDLASYQVGPGAVTGLAPGSNGFTGITPDQAGDWEQTSYAAYGDVEVPVTDLWTVGTAVRYEDFSEFGDKVTGKFATRYALRPWIGLRASYSTGFRAPTPGQLNSTSTSQGLDTVTLQLFTTGRLSPNSPVAQAFGAQPLEPEESKTTSAGFTWQTDFGFSGSLDVYNIDVSERFSQSRTFTVTPAIRQQLIAAGVPGAESFTGVSFFTNDFDTRTRGVDLVGAYAKRVGPGRLDLTAAYNYNDTKVTSGSLTADPTQRTVFEEGIPSQNVTASVGYGFGLVKLTTRARYYGPWTDSTGNTTGNLTQRFGSFTQLDLMADWAFTDNVSFALGAENVLDDYPDEAVFQASRGLIYSRNAPYGTDGGRYYMRLNVKY
jgi:iron complex outermembrane recepter protein